MRLLALLYGFVCHTSFALGVGAMITSMYFGMSLGLGHLSGPVAWSVNCLLLAQFVVVHSLLLSRRGQGILSRLAPRSVGANLSTTIYATIASWQLASLFGLWTPSGVMLWELTGIGRGALTIAYAASWLMLFMALKDAGLALQSGSLGWTAVFAGRRPRYPDMPERGLYRLCRQPIYLSFTLATWTTPTFTLDQLVVALVLTGYCVVGPRFRERRALAAWGDRYRAYQRATPYMLPLGQRGRDAAVDEPPRTGGGLLMLRNNLTIYDDSADTWWSGEERFLRLLHNLVPARMKHLDTLVSSWAGKRVVDVGCGGGFMSEALARRGADVTGVDPSGPAVEAARAHAATEGLKIRYEVGKGEQLPLGDETFDIAVCVDVLEHVVDVGQVLQEISRVLKPGGLFLFDTINRTRVARVVMITFAEDILRLLPRGTHDPAKFVRPAELVEAAREAELTVQELVGLGPRSINRRLDFTFGRLPGLGVMYMGTATRA